MLLAEITATELTSPLLRALGSVTAFQRCPSQWAARDVSVPRTFISTYVDPAGVIALVNTFCNCKALKLAKDDVLVPKAQISLAEISCTVFSTPFWSEAGSCTTFQCLPSQCSTRGELLRKLPLCVPIAQISLAETAVMLVRLSPELPIKAYKKTPLLAGGTVFFISGLGLST